MGEKGKGISRRIGAAEKHIGSKKQEFLNPDSMESLFRAKVNII